MDPQSLQRFLAPLLIPLGICYKGVMHLRRRLWKWKNPPLPPCPCIAVGNISWGGTGKTPLVDWLLGNTTARGLHPVVLTRGYGAHPPHLPFLVTDKASPLQAGDEPLMLHQRHPSADILVDPVRTRAKQLALHELNPDLLLLDDGFQHLAVARHLNLVLLRPEDLCDQWDRVLPAGSWREGKNALHHADAFLIKTDKAGMRKLMPQLNKFLRVLKKPVFSFTLRPGLIRRAGKGSGPLPQGAYILVSGVGNPKQVRTTASRLMRCAPHQHLVFSDHHAYTVQDAADIKAFGLPVLCTSKDADKLSTFDLNLWEMPVTTTFGPSLWCDRPFPLWWKNWLDKALYATAQGLPVPPPEGYDSTATSLDSGERVL